MIPRLLFYLFNLCACSGIVLFAAPQVISLDSGERVMGEVLAHSTDEMLHIQSGLLGEITIARERVVKIEPQAKAVPAKAVKPQKVPEVMAEPKKQIALTDEEIEHIEERRIIDTLKEFKAPDSWKGNLRMGMNLSQGDRKWTESYARGNLEIKPHQSPHFYRFNGSYTYRETERSDGSSYKSTDKYDATFIYRGTFYDNWFVQNSIGGRVDQIKGIEREIQEAVGVGYSYKPNKTFEVLVGAGGGIEQFETDYVDEREGWNGVMNVFQEAEWKPFPRTSFIQKFNYYWNPEDSADFNYALTAAIRYRLTDLIGFEFSYNKDFDNDIGSGNSKDDTQWRNALVVYF